MSKPLKDWTFGEVIELCQSMDHCWNCTFHSGQTFCRVADMLRGKSRPMEWNLAEPSLLTEPELAICRAIGARWVTKEKCSGSSAYLWDIRPTGKNGKYIDLTKTSGAFIAILSGGLFPSVRPGDCVEVPDG